MAFIMVWTFDVRLFFGAGPNISGFLSLLACARSVDDPGTSFATRRVLDGIGALTTALGFLPGGASPGAGAAGGGGGGGGGLFGAGSGAGGPVLGRFRDGCTTSASGVLFGGLSRVVSPAAFEFLPDRSPVAPM